MTCFIRRGRYEKFGANENRGFTRNTVTLNRQNKQKKHLETFKYILTREAFHSSYRIITSIKIRVYERYGEKNEYNMSKP